MAVHTLQWTKGRFQSLVSGSSSTLLELPLSLGIVAGDSLIFEEVTVGLVATGRYARGVVSSLPSGQFFNLSSGQGYYYISPMSNFVWVDYSALSTVVGWSAFTAKVIQYAVVGNLVFVRYRIAGTSNSVLANFTVPFIHDSNGYGTNGFLNAINNNVSAAQPGSSALGQGSAQVNCYRDPTGLAWSNINTKSVAGEFFYAIPTP